MLLFLDYMLLFLDYMLLFLDYEISRHMQLLSEGGVVVPETRSYDERKQ